MILKLNSLEKLEEMAGLPMPQDSRDMTPYNGKHYNCTCGNSHIFSHIYNERNYVASGANATMIIRCLNNPGIKTLITTKYKFIVVFKGFESIAGYVGN